MELPAEVFRRKRPKRTQSFEVLATPGFHVIADQFLTEPPEEAVRESWAAQFELSACKYSAEQLAGLYASADDVIISMKNDESSALDTCNGIQTWDVTREAEDSAAHNATPFGGIDVFMKRDTHWSLWIAQQLQSMGWKANMTGLNPTAQCRSITDIASCYGPCYRMVLKQTYFMLTNQVLAQRQVPV